MGKVFGFIEAVDSGAPIIASTAYTKIFTSTMNTMPGFIFQIMAGLIIFPIVCLIWIDLYASTQMKSGPSNSDQQNINKQNDNSANNRFESKYTQTTEINETQL